MAFAFSDMGYLLHIYSQPLCSQYGKHTFSNGIGGQTFWNISVYSI